jgi:hypothetical protein
VTAAVIWGCSSCFACGLALRPPRGWLVTSCAAGVSHAGSVGAGPANPATANAWANPAPAKSPSYLEDDVEETAEACGAVGIADRGIVTAAERADCAPLDAGNLFNQIRQAGRRWGFDSQSRLSRN